LCGPLRNPKLFAHRIWFFLADFLKVPTATVFLLRTRAVFSVAFLFFLLLVLHSQWGFQTVNFPSFVGLNLSFPGPRSFGPPASSSQIIPCLQRGVKSISFPPLPIFFFDRIFWSLFAGKGKPLSCRFSPWTIGAFLFPRFTGRRPAAFHPLVLLPHFFTPSPPPQALMPTPQPPVFFLPPIFFWIYSDPFPFPNGDVLVTPRVKVLFLPIPFPDFNSHPPPSVR